MEHFGRSRRPTELVVVAVAAALALADALGVPPAAAAELLPVIEAVMVAKLNEQMDHSNG